MPIYNEEFFTTIFSVAFLPSMALLLLPPLIFTAALSKVSVMPLVR